MFELCDDHLLSFTVDDGWKIHCTSDGSCQNFRGRQFRAFLVPVFLKPFLLFEFNIFYFPRAFFQKKKKNSLCFYCSPFSK